MRLRKIKLAGFKSFVEPTSLLVADNLVGVVGPNGCGKSNIMDAVTWVMGESSAKHLRGDALTDVIFNGSNTRQPVGQATVELIFDNSEGKVGGQFANYAEISVKRQLNREPVSSYYLNGVRCRRKDIQSIFLGTGLGPRSYSIIEQGVISRLIEARPEELRTFLEEAAGISRFRERRRETENRIRHTRDNIDRLASLREELEKQLDHLQRQAKAAERFKTLKQEERRLKAELLALNWRGLSTAADEKAETVRFHENQVEQGLAGLRGIEAELETRRQEYIGANDDLNRAQAEFYQIGSDISRLEQQIDHARERMDGMNADLAGARESEQALQRQLQDDRGELTVITEKNRLLEPRLQGYREKGSEARSSLDHAEETMRAWQDEWDALNQEAAELNKRIEVDEMRLELLRAGLDESEQRRKALKEETDALSADELKQQITQLDEARSESEELLRQRKSEHDRIVTQLQQHRAELASGDSRLTEMRADYQENESKIASLEALQYGDALDHRETLTPWLATLGLAEAPRLVDSVEVREGWETAFEAVAGAWLQNISVDDLRGAAEAAATLEAGRVGLLLNSAAALEYTPKSFPRLIDQVSSTVALEALLNRVYLAEDLEQAGEICGQLDEDESVVTRDGLWMNNYWMRIQRPGDDAPGLLSREQQLSRLKSRQTSLENEIRTLETSAAEQNERVHETDRKSGELLAQLHEQQEKAAGIKARYAEINTRYEQSVSRERQIASELQGLQQQEKDHRAEMTSLEGRLEADRRTGKKLEGRRSRLEGLRTERTQTLDKAREQWQNTHEDSHEIALQLQDLRSQENALEQAIKRSEIQISGTRERIRGLENELQAQDLPLQELGRSLEGRLSEKVTAEAGLTTAREAVQQQEKQVKDKEQERHEQDQRNQELRAGLEQARMSHEQVRIRSQTVEEQLQAMNHSPQSLLEELDEAAEPALWQDKIDGVERRIQRLGPINLAAIDEYEQLAERKTYLDSQHEDLNAALDTLEAAIRRIDRETRTRFKETFDRLNDNLKENFPILFGGGYARLEMTDPDLLETGITVMARPPGKNNSNIHLLSGGEKALTAIALVFSIFKLNPAPFCILDEVDAPLDDNNVGRFCEMVKTMSRDVQFIIITHNKITMEITRQLLGVTMHEAGVSRLVSVDLDEAVEMAASA